MRGRRCHGRAWMGKGGDIAATAPSPGLVATAAASEREDGGGERVGGWWRQSIGRRDVRGDGDGAAIWTYGAVERRGSRRLGFSIVRGLGEVKREGFFRA